jgi:hypothetical protein
MNLIMIVILLLVNILLSKSFTSSDKSVNRFSISKLNSLRVSVDSYIREARELLSSDTSETEIMKVAILLSIKDKENQKLLMEKDKELMEKDKEKDKELMEKDKEKDKELMEKDKEKELMVKKIEMEHMLLINYYLKKLSILSLRYHHTY